MSPNFGKQVPNRQDYKRALKEIHTETVRNTIYPIIYCKLRPGTNFHPPPEISFGGNQTVNYRPIKTIPTQKWGFQTPKIVHA